ncbi:MAG: metallophosphoesterase [Phycisphaerales bacterium JB065]
MSPTDNPRFDIVGDLHGCADEFRALIQKLGYTLDDPQDEFGAPSLVWAGDGPPRRLALVGDLVDRGPASVAILKIVRRAVNDGAALAVIGNHDDKLRRWLKGNCVTIKHGLETTIAEFDREPESFREAALDFLDELPEMLTLDEGRLIVTHASYREDMPHLSPKHRRSLCLYGPSTGRTDEHGLPERIDWAPDYSGDAYVVYGHTPVAQPRWCGRTVNVDTGCVFGGALTALRYPELQTVSVPSVEQYVQPRRPFL